MSIIPVLQGRRRELRRVMVEGSAYWAEPINGGLRLGDGREIADEIAGATLRYLPPCAPSKILCVHTNFRSRVFEFTGKTSVPATPTYFQKPITALNAHGGQLVRPQGSRYLNYEGELAVVIGRPTRNIQPAEAWDHIAGFSVSNDVGLHDMRDTDAGSMLRVKGQDGFCPIGPALVSGVDVRESTIRTYLNAVLVQDGTVAEMIFGVDYLIADLARHITLMPGDIVLTGTPANSRPMQPGDLIEVEISGLGRLTNHVVESPAPQATVGHAGTDSEDVRRVALGSDERLPEALKGASLSARAKR
jgi:5-oxopent-3-ene-1,2,5-tricarboxylate decarboxylase / 2-hydroxyhepta-2,4-diene-1,7-dioate isomerase